MAAYVVYVESVVFKERVVGERLEVPESRTSMMANLLGVLVERRSDERTSRLMRGRVPTVIEDILSWLLEVFSTVKGRKGYC